VKKFSERLTYANVVSTICLFLLLGGATAFAAVHLKKNSVGTKQLKKNSVTGAKVKNQTLTGKDIKLSKLGKVPLAAHADAADSAGSANSLSPAEPIHLVGAPGEPSFLAGASDATFPGVTLPPVGFYKDHEGIVHLEGLAMVGKPGAEGGLAPIFNLPPGFRPQAGLNIFPGGLESATAIAGTNESLEATNFNAGDVVGAEEQLAVLSGITFRALN
jgi:hypothetical protein